MTENQAQSNYLSKKKKKRKRQYGGDETYQHNRNERMKQLQEEMNQNCVNGGSQKNSLDDNGETWMVPKKKHKKENQIPSFQCNLDELFSNNGSRAQGTHLKFADIRSMFMLPINGSNHPCFPTWCRLNAWKKIQKTIILMLGYVSENDFQENKECFKYLNSAFGQAVPVRHDGSDYSIKSPLESFLRYRMTKRLQQIKISERNNDNMKTREFYDYVLSDDQLKCNEYPQWNPSAKEHGVLSTRTEDKRIYPNKDSELYAIDCEMCNAAGNQQVLTRISIVNSDLETVYDKLVKPDVPITDYVTKFSGITPEMLENVTTRLADVQADILALIKPDTILVGHSLDFDLRALKIHHDNIIDTSVLYVDQRGPRYKSSLKNLVKTYLSRDIQNSTGGHCSIEDAKSCMELVLLKIQKGAAFGNMDWEFESIFEALNREGKTGAIIDTPNIVRQHCFGSVHGVPCISDDEVIKNAKRFAKEVNFTFAHLKTYENLISGGSSNEEPLTKEQKQAAFRMLDTSVEQIISVAHPETLVVVSLSSGFVHPSIMLLLRDKEKRKSEVAKTALKAAKNAVCFIKVTSQ